MAGHKSLGELAVILVAVSILGLRAVGWPARIV
jgi:hypothetical protein